MEKLILIKTLEQLKQLQEYLTDKTYIAYDTETNGVDKESSIIGFSISAEPEIGYYVVLSYWDTAANKLQTLETVDGTKELISSLVGKSLIMHNAIFDCWMTYNNFGVSLIESVHTDTMILGHLLDENRSNGLKELGTSLFGENSRKEQAEMKESVLKNGGMLTKAKYELYKADADLIGKYGAKDAILTLKLFYTLVPELYTQGLDKFFYDEESMPLLKGPTYELNTTGLRVDPEKLEKLRGSLEVECMEAKAFIHKEITPHVQEKYKGTSKVNTFNIGSSKQLAWLLFAKLKNDYVNLTEGGRELCKAVQFKPPYSPSDRRKFIQFCVDNKGIVYEDAKANPKTGKLGRPKKIGDPWNYIACGKETLGKLAGKYKFVEKLLEYAKAMKLLNTYAIGIQSRTKYSIIRPSFLQIGTTSGRYSSKAPNFQNLPRDDKRVKACIVARPGRSFVGADYSQLEPRVFASVSQDPTLLACFEKGEDFYSVVGIPIFSKERFSPYKKDSNAFAEKFPELRNIAKAFALATPYGTSAFQQSRKLGKSQEECEDIIAKYFSAYPRVEMMMLAAHETAKRDGVVYSIYGRPRRIPEALEITKIYGNVSHGELPYKARTLLNLGMNHSVQSSAASIVNRAAIAFWKYKIEYKLQDCNIILQLHDELIIECKDEDTDTVNQLLKLCMEETTELPGVKLIAEPKIAKDLASLK